jgi:para-nitrobenzyl esterase
VVATSAGLISRRSERGALVFRGVPYARPPLGPLLYHKPIPSDPSEGVRPCESFAARSLQGSVRRGGGVRVLEWV